MSSVGLSSSDLATLLGSSSSSSNSIDLSSILEAATGSSTEGIDVTSAVNAAVTAAEAPETQWKAEQTTIQGPGKRPDESSTARPPRWKMIWRR